MRMMLGRHSQTVLCILALLGTVYAVDCTARAWVRAPDLIPDTVIQGDARIKISTYCPGVDTVILGLRLRELSLVEALRHGSQKDKLRVPLRSAKTLGKIPSDPWIFQKEERLVFETTWAIDVPDGDEQDVDVVRDFAVLVPYTNFPPALDHATQERELGSGVRVTSEFQYEYFIRVSFANGTTVEISAGITSFQPRFDVESAPQESNFEIAQLRRIHFGGAKDSTTISTYTAEISSASVVAVSITRTGPAHTFTEPLQVRGCVEPSVSSKWAVARKMTSSHNKYGSVLRSTPEDFEDSKQSPMRPLSSCYRDTGLVSFTMPSATAEEIESRTIVTTRSAPVTLPIEVDRRHVPNFNLSYQTLINSLKVTLETPRTKCETVDPDNPSVEHPSHLHQLGFTDDEGPWVPWEERCHKTWGTYVGKVSVVVHPVTQVTHGCVPPRTSASHQVTLEVEHGCQQRSLIHYLDEGARGPTFVDPSTIHELLAKTPLERELLAPLLAPVVSSPPEGEELDQRYQLRVGSHRVIYVGETWSRRENMTFPPLWDSLIVIYVT